MSELRSRTAVASLSTETREDDAERLIAELRKLVRWGELQIACNPEGEWGVTWWEDPPGQPDSNYTWERSTFGAAATLTEALREALDTLREARS